MAGSRASSTTIFSIAFAFLFVCLAQEVYFNI